MVEDLLPTLWWKLSSTGPLAAVQGFLQSGGPVLLLIGLVGALLWSLLLERWWFFRFICPKRNAVMVARWQARRHKYSWTSRRIRAAMIRAAKGEMGEGLTTIRMLIAVCPLLGLLGTVTGMIAVFDVVALVGTGDAQAMAAGVSRATIPTMAGMVVGISGLFPLYRFTARARIEAERLADHLDPVGHYGGGAA